MRAISCVCIFLIAGCAGPSAEQVQTAIFEATGELRPIHGTDTPSFPVTFQLMEYGSSTPMLQEIAMVHAVAGAPGSVTTVYRVGFEGGEPRIVLRGRMGDTEYQVLWESWPEGMARAGSPPAEWIRFNE